MQTKLTSEVLETEAGKEADGILRNCVHCGFCTATCPTYQLLGDELDGPRGRIYLIKEMLENNHASEKTLEHLDRCLGCSSCETTCPSGVAYMHLAQIGKSLAEEKAGRPLGQRVVRKLLLSLLPHRARFSILVSLLRVFRPFLPRNRRKQLEKGNNSSFSVQNSHARKVLLIEGCVQPSLSPEIDSATITLLDRLGIETLRTGQAQCCGAVENHLGAKDAGLARIRANIDAWLPLLEGAEAVISTASACALEIKEYGYLMRHDPEYREKAEQLSSMSKDISEVLVAESLDEIRISEPKRIAFHPPCTLQHGQKLKGVVEGILTSTGFELTPIPDSHLCCGSAGTYSLLQPELGGLMRENKVNALLSGNPELIATSNIGCQSHLKGGMDLPVLHWVELLANGIDR